MDQQMNLELGAKRTRARLLDDTQPAPRKRAVLVEEKEEATPFFSPWTSCLINPPVSGEWDVRPVVRPGVVNRYFFDAKRGYWFIDGWPFGTVIEGTHEWRGLAQDPNGLPKDINWEAPL